MGRKKRYQIRNKQKIKRRKRLERLRKKNLNISDYYSDGRYIGPKHSR